MMSSINIALAQWNIRKGEPDYNSIMMKEMVAAAKERLADLLILPEMWYLGYDYNHFDRYSSGFDEGGFAIMSKAAAHYNMAVCGSSVRKENGVFYNTMAFFNRRGNLHFYYDKIHLFGPMGESHHFAAGDRVQVRDWNGWNIGMAVCYDLRFPELFRAFVDRDVHLAVLCAQWPNERAKHWDLLLQTRAIDNQMFVAGCNRIGEDESYQFPGRSAIIDPGGEAIIRASGNEGIWVGTIESMQFNEHRQKLPFVKDRRKDLF